MKNLNDLDAILRQEPDVIGFDHNKVTNDVRIYVSGKELYLELSNELKDFRNVMVFIGRSKHGRGR